MARCWRVFPRRESPIHEAGNDDDVPLQTLGSVDGEDLHRVPRRLHGRPLEATLLRNRGIQPSEEPEQRWSIG